MNREYYSTRDFIEEDITRLEQQANDASDTIVVIKTLVFAVCVLARAVADVADATRRHD